MIQHEVISASAGTGKTWQLATRCIALLAAGAAPESIAALTFSRAAAGEFFSRILTRLAEAADDADKCRALADAAEAPQLNPKACLSLLRSLIDRMPFLMLGTLDSFFVRIVRAFPMELGLAGDFSIMDDHRRLLERARVHEYIFLPEVAPTRAAEREEFLLAFEEARFGRDEASILHAFDSFVDDWHLWFLENPDPAAWGRPERIWPDGPPALPEGSWDSILSRAQDAATKLGNQEKWQDVFSGLSAAETGVPLSRDIPTLWKNLLAIADGLAAGNAILTNSKKFEVTGETAAALSDLVRFVCRRQIDGRLRQTRAIRAIIAAYDDAYHQRVRRRGQLTFQDVLGFLDGSLATGNAHEQGGLTFASRQLLDYRLDGRYRHWLLDEFQDTSRAQWRVLRGLCDEALQDTDGERSFFAVGDAKQSIHVWRGAAPELIDEILDLYNGARDPSGSRPREHIAERPLNDSRRSGPSIIDMVNRLFGNHEALAAFPDLAPALARWRFPEHTTHHTNRRDHATVIEVEPDPDNARKLDHQVWGACAALLGEIDPIARGLSCVVLCHRNQRALEIADFLRRETGMEVVADADATIARDNPVCSALLDLLAASAHPEHHWAWQHVCMTPLRAVIESRFPSGTGSEPERRAALRAPVAAAIIRSLLHEGFAAVLRSWIDGLRTLKPLDPFSLARTDELLRCAAAFDESGSRCIDTFIDFAEAWKERETAGNAAIRVMNVHKAKGLTFGVVIIPDLHDAKMFNSRDSIAWQRRGERIDWITRLPGKEICRTDPVLTKALSEMNTRAWQERLAQLYVMTTRAEHAQYIILPQREQKKSQSAASSLSLEKIVRATLVTGTEATPFPCGSLTASRVASWGDPRWHDGHPKQEPAAPRPAVQVDLFAAAPPTAAPRRRRTALSRRTPTAGRRPVFNAMRLESMAAGSAVHDLLSRLAWADAADAAWTQAVAAAPRDVAAAADRCLSATDVRKLLERPAGPHVLWREKAFDLIADEEWISGVFDRVVLHKDSEGGFTAATLIEFKTDAVKDAEAAAELLPERHADQLKLYRQAIVALTGLAPAAVEAWIVAIAVPCAVRVPDAP